MTKGKVLSIVYIAVVIVLAVSYYFYTIISPVPSRDKTVPSKSRFI